MSVDELSASEIDRRYNHWDQNDSVSRCDYCGSFMPKPEGSGKSVIKCEACDRWNTEYVR